MLLPPALGFSPHPPVSVYGTGTVQTIAAFLDTRLTDFATLFRSRHGFPLVYGFAFTPGTPLGPGFPFPASALRMCPHSSVIPQYRMSTCCPSATAPALALGPDLPRADQLYSGNLGYSAIRILTLFSLLIPAFSLPYDPLLLPVQLRLICNAPLPTFRFLSFGGAFQPRTFSAQDLSTSELLRTL